MTNEELLARGVSEVIDKNSLEEKLKSGKKLRVKLGIDPTGPDIHLGHTVPLRKMRAFQEMGHLAVFLVGDYTAKIGDPSGKDKTRTALTDEDIQKNADGYFDQAFKILDKDKTEIHMQSEWYQDMNLDDILDLTRRVSVAQLLEHETFKNRVAKKLPFTMMEMLYPILQGYDSVALKADVELGATEQKFNLLMGRQLQKSFGQPEQDIITLNYLPGTDGAEKMGKTTGNYIGINDAPADMYGKVMSIPDSVIVPYYELITDVTEKGIGVIKKELADGKNPRQVKAELAYLIVEQNHSAEKAEEAQAEFDRVYKNKEMPSEIREISVAEEKMNAIDLVSVAISISKSEAKRLIEQNAVEIGSTKISDPFQTIEIKEGMVIKAGRKFAKIKK